MNRGRGCKGPPVDVRGIYRVLRQPSHALAGALVKADHVERDRGMREDLLRRLGSHGVEVLLTPVRAQRERLRRALGSDRPRRVPGLAADHRARPLGADPCGSTPPTTTPIARTGRSDWNRRIHPPPRGVAQVLPAVDQHLHPEQLVGELQVQRVLRRRAVERRAEPGNAELLRVQLKAQVATFDEEFRSGAPSLEDATVGVALPLFDLVWVTAKADWGCCGGSQQQR